MALKASVIFTDSYVTRILRHSLGIYRELSKLQGYFHLVSPRFVHLPAASLVRRSCLCLQAWHLPLLLIMTDELGNLL